MYIGIDLGTSGVKAILLNEQGEVVASHTEKLTVSRPHPLWSEQDPEQWWQATDTAMKALGAQHSLRDVKALGIAPASVSEICRVVRCNSRVPSLSSSRLMRLETTAGESPRSRAAVDMLPAAITRTKTSRSPRLVMSRCYSFRFCHKCISFALRKS